MAHVVIAVGELERSTDFYEALSGTSAYAFGRVDSRDVARAMGFEGIAFRYAAFKLSNLRLVLREFDEPVPWRGAVEIVDNGNVHVCLEVDHLTSALSRLHHSGIIANGPPAPAPAPHERAGIDQVLFLDGPDGEHVELVGPVSQNDEGYGANDLRD